MSAYAELAVTTNFSFLRGASHPAEMVATADELKLAAIGIADRNSFAGVVRAYDEWKKRKNIKLVVGTRLITVGAMPSEPGIGCRQHQKSQKRRGNDPPYNDGRERSLHLRSSAGRKGHRKKTEARYGGGHQDRPQADDGGLINGRFQRLPNFPELTYEGHKHQPIEDGYA